MERLQAIRRKLILCAGHDWMGAAEIVMGQIQSACRDVPYSMQQLEEAVRACNLQAPSVKEVYQELIQAEEEFDGLTYHLEGDLLAVSTDPIELEGIYLGVFEIQLHLPSLDENGWCACLTCGCGSA